MWDLPGAGLEPVSPALAGRFLTTAPLGKPCFMGFYAFLVHFFVSVCLVFFLSLILGLVCLFSFFLFIVLLLLFVFDFAICLGFLLFHFFPLFFFLLWLHCAACRFLVPQPGVNPGPPGWKC